MSSEGELMFMQVHLFSSIIISTWAYTSNEVNLSFDDSDAVLLTHFKVTWVAFYYTNI